MNSEKLKDLAIKSIEELKGKDIAIIDVRGKANFTDFMIVVSGTSDRHLRAIANQIHIDSKLANHPPLSTEDKESKEWILVDLGDVIIHIMHPDTRALYEIEKLWSIGRASKEEA